MTLPETKRRVVNIIILVSTWSQLDFGLDMSMNSNILSSYVPILTVHHIVFCLSTVGYVPLLFYQFILPSTHLSNQHDQAIKRPFNQTIIRPINQSINQSIKQLFNQSTNNSINQLINHSFNQAINQLLNQVES